jgi:hypothetical protein
MADIKVTTMTDLQTQTATHLSAIELGLGSVLHAFKIPFTGHFLSLNQGFFLSYTIRILSRSTTETRFQLSKITFEISILTALLKSLSPAGQKWGPMLSISMQGILYSLGIFIFGANILGSLIGMYLLCTWAFIQPFITLLISFGFSEMQKIIHFYIERLQKDYSVSSDKLLQIIFIIFIVKILIATALIFFAFYLKSNRIKSLQEKMRAQQKNKLKSNSFDQKSIHQKVFSDATKPLFLFSFAMAYIFLFITEDNIVSFLWKALRPLAIAVLFFYFLRSTYCSRLILTLISKSKYLKSLHEKSQIVFNQLD